MGVARAHARMLSRVRPALLCHTGAMRGACPSAYLQLVQVQVALLRRVAKPLEDIRLIVI